MFCGIVSKKQLSKLEGISVNFVILMFCGPILKTQLPTYRGTMFMCEKSVDRKNSTATMLDIYDYVK